MTRITRKKVLFTEQEKLFWIHKVSPTVPPPAYTAPPDYCVVSDQQDFTALPEYSRDIEDILSESDERCKLWKYLPLALGPPGFLIFIAISIHDVAKKKIKKRKAKRALHAQIDSTVVMVDT